MSSKKPTLRDLSKHLNLGLSTVSMALKGHPRISAATCKRVKAAAKKIGYTPDPRISSVMSYLKAKRSDKPAAAIAYITKYSEEIQLEKHRIYHNYLLGARERAQELGYRLEYINMTADHLSGKRLTTILLNRGIEGVIIPPVFLNHDSIGIEYDKFASITFGYSLDHEYIHRVSLDHYLAVFQALNRIAAHGYQRIGFVMEVMKERVQHRWRAAHLTFLDTNPNQEAIPPLDEKYDHDVFLKWFFKYKPSAILSQRVDWAKFLQDEGLICGIDYGFASLSKDSIDFEISQLPGRNLHEQFRDAAGLNQESFHTGRYAVEFLSQEMALNHKGLPSHPKTTLIRGKWEDGKTLSSR